MARFLLASELVTRDARFRPQGRVALCAVLALVSASATASARQDAEDAPTTNGDAGSEPVADDAGATSTIDDAGPTRTIDDAGAPTTNADAGATEPPAPPIGGIDYFTARYEPAAFPTFGGDTDIGAKIGIAGALTRFGNGTRPYIWKLNVVLSASFKDDAEGFRLVQEDYIVALDLPHAFGSDVRLMPATGFVRTIDAPYFGRGNGPKAAAPSYDTDPTRYHQFTAQTFFVRDITRILVKRPYEIVFEPIVRYLAPRDYGGSLLESDASGTNGGPVVHGLKDEALVTIAGGLIIDSRDNELFPKSGVFHQIGVKYVQGIPFDGNVEYGGASGVFAGYFHLGGEAVLALRGVVDFEVGNVPFFDLYTGGPFRLLQLPGGSTGVRGVPLGLYSGLIKTVGNVELRDLFVTFRIVRQKIRIGGDAFFDAGRAFDDYTFDSPRDGSGIGIHWGTGGGLYVGWGDAALIRVEVAHSPDAFPVTLPFTSIKAPVGIYVGDNVMF